MINFFKQFKKLHTISLDTDIAVNYNLPGDKYKNYYRFSKYPLNVDGKIETTNNFFDVLKNRRSIRKRAKKITEIDLSKIFQGISRIDEESDLRYYPSAGALYPIETYLIVLNPIGEIQKGIYHYSVEYNCLEYMFEIQNIAENFDKLYDSDLKAGDSQAILIFSGVVDRYFWKYGNFGFFHQFVEVGHMCQNISLISSLLGISNYSCGAMKLGKISNLLDLESNETPLISMIFP